MSQKIGTLRLALTFAGCFLGAGYVSGQELWQYFGAFGARGLLGLVLAVALLGGTGVLLLRLSARTGIETMDALIVRADIPWLRTVVGVLTAALLFGVVCIMAAGIGALGEQMLGLPVWLGAAIACVLIAAAAYFGLGGMVSVFTVAVPCMIVAALVIAGIRLHRTGLTAAAFAAGDTNPMLGNWATSAVNYAAYNFFATVGILAPLTRHLKKPGTAVWGTVLGCVLLLAVALGVLAALAVSPESVGAQLPMLDLACRLGTAGVVYAVLLFLGMFGTSVSSLVAVLTYAGQKSARLAGHRMALLLVLTAAAFAGSLFGFGDLIGTVYPVYGYLGMAAMLLVAEHAVYAVLLFLGMFGTSVSSLVAVLTYAGQKSARLAGHRMALLLVLTAAAFAGSLFGFGDLIGTVYPVYGYLGMAAMLLVAEHAVHARRAGKHCAATGD